LRQCGEIEFGPLLTDSAFRCLQCLVFPPLGCSLYDFLRANRFSPLFPHHIKHIAQQLLTACAGLHQIGVVHADIKPENILLVDASYTTVQIQNLTVNVPLCTDIRLTDFGTAVFDSHEKPMIVVSRSYRPLEVVLGLEWSFGVDVWAIGCVLMELYTGHRLFNISSSADDVAHVKLMEQMLGPVPVEIKSKSRLWSMGGNHWISPAPSPRESPHPSPAHTPASTPPGSPGRHARSLFPTLKDRIVPSDTQFYDLVSKMLLYDQNERISAIEALQHPYFAATSGS
jgi:dual-specificity kinase